MLQQGHVTIVGVFKQGAQPPLHSAQEGHPASWRVQGSQGVNE